jgi:hypothetical protein
MPRDGAIIFGNLIGKLDVLRIEVRDPSGRRSNSVYLGSPAFPRPSASLA